jgi:hypothetical protein
MEAFQTLCTSYTYSCILLKAAAEKWQKNQLIDMWIPIWVLQKKLPVMQRLQARSQPLEQLTNIGKSTHIDILGNNNRVALLML